MSSAAAAPLDRRVRGGAEDVGMQVRGSPTSWSVLVIGATKTILFSLAIGDTAGPSPEVSVPTRKSTFSRRISSRATRTASSALPLVSRGHQLDLAAAEHAAGGVDLVDVHLRALERRLAEQGARAGQDHRESDPDGFLRVCGRRQRQGERERQHQKIERRFMVPPSWRRCGCENRARAVHFTIRNGISRAENYDRHAAEKSSRRAIGRRCASIRHAVQERGDRDRAWLRLPNS